MEHYKNMGEDYSTDNSSDSLYAMHVDMDVENNNCVANSVLGTTLAEGGQGTSSLSLSLDSSNMQGGIALTSQFQELVMRALFQSTAALLGPLSGQVPPSQAGFSETPLVGTGEVQQKSTWTESAYKKAEAKRKRNPQVVRTSAGEDSDLQEDFRPVENESPQQRSQRARRLNRARARRAKELTSNRRAVNKLPYVIYVDGTCKIKGIHKHLWRATVRGQCGRLDPTMDNIHHHPKHIVDSIWQGLEKEWEFEGFVHRAREMFERSATKFMRNRKMQLKSKCQKNLKGPKPHDVSDAHWAKIVELTKKSMKQAASSSSRHSTPKGKENMPIAVDGDRDLAFQFLQGNTDDSEGKSWNSNLVEANTVAAEDDKINEKIESLEKELMRLQKQRKIGSSAQQNALPKGPVCLREMKINGPLDAVFKGGNMSMIPRDGKGDLQREGTSRTSSKRIADDVQGKDLQTAIEKDLTVVVYGGENLQEVNVEDDFEVMQMDCGDVVRLFALNGGRKEEIGKGIVMGLAGSKYAWKIIPQGWRSIKVTSFTYEGAFEACPFPAGWSGDVKQQTIKEASGQTIIWPDSLLGSFLNNLQQV